MKATVSSSSTPFPPKNCISCRLVKEIVWNAQSGKLYMKINIAFNVTAVKLSYHLQIYPMQAVK